MNALTRSILSLVPGLPWGRASAAGRVFAGLFYLWGVVMTLNAGRLARLEGAERAGLLAALAAVYAAAVALPALAGAGKGRFAARFEARGAAMAGFAAILVVVSAAVLAPILTDYAPDAFDDPAGTRLLAPSTEHPLGTDRIGRDVWTRVLYGARASLGIGVLSVLLSVILALALGCGAALAGGWVDDVIARLTDGMLAFPRQLFVLTLVAFFTNSVALLVVAIAVTSWMRIARLVRAEILRLAETEFVKAASATGASAFRVLTRHILPNALGPVIVAATLNVGAVILLESYLSFLGLGVQPPTPSWGAMVFEGRDVLLDAWWVSAFPAVAITACVVAFNVLGDGLRDALDTRSVARRTGA